jgi:hypothetical protein
MDGGDLLLSAEGFDMPGNISSTVTGCSQAPKVDKAVNVTRSCMKRLLIGELDCFDFLIGGINILDCSNGVVDFPKRSLRVRTDQRLRSEANPALPPFGIETARVNMSVLTRGRVLRATVPISEGPVLWSLAYFLSICTVRSRSGALAPFRYLPRNSSIKERVNSILSSACSNALSSGFESRVNLLETRPASVKLM